MGENGMAFIFPPGVFSMPVDAGLRALEILVVAMLLLVMALAAAFWVYGRAPSRKNGGPARSSAPTVGNRELKKYKKETAHLFP